LWERIYAMVPPLSVQQFAAIALGQSKAPWHLGNLCALYNQSPISLKNSLAALSAAQTVIFVDALRVSTSTAWQSTYADATQATGEPTSDDNFNTYWAFGSLQPTDLTSLAELLKPSGAFISYLGDGVTVASGVIGITGTFAELASLNVTEVPGYPSSWTPNDLDAVNHSSFLLNGLAGGIAYTDYDKTQDTGVDAPNPYAQPLAALSPGVSSDRVGTGLLGVVGLNQGVNALQALIGLVNQARAIILSLTANLSSMPALQGIDASVAAINTFTQWLTYLKALTITDIPPSITISAAPGSQPFSISEIIYTIEDASQATFSISEFIVNADGTSTGGVIS
jgi:hypothetical protein